MRPYNLARNPLLTSVSPWKVMADVFVASRFSINSSVSDIHFVSSCSFF